MNLRYLFLMKRVPTSKPNAIDTILMPTTILKTKDTQENIKSIVNIENKFVSKLLTKYSLSASGNTLTFLKFFNNLISCLSTTNSDS